MNDRIRTVFVSLFLISSCAFLSAEKKSSAHSAARATVVIPFGSREKESSADKKKVVIKREVSPGIFSYEFDDGTKLSREELTEFFRASSDEKPENNQLSIGSVAAECLYTVIEIGFQEACEKAERQNLIP